jgi:23S rRNA pseudouridine1911/1915/1917 synthase
MWRGNEQGEKTIHRLYVTWVHDGSRLDAFIHALIPSLSRSRAKALVDCGKVLVNGEIRKASYIVREGDVVEVEIAPEPKGEFDERLLMLASQMQVDVLYEDEHILVVNKPRGIVVHPSHTTSEPTLMHALLAKGYRLSKVGGEKRLGIVHRLDKDTSGCLIVAKTDEAHLALQQQFANRSIEKRYLAIVVGSPKWQEMHVSAPLGRDRKNRQRMTVNEHSGKHAETHFSVIERYGEFTLVEALMLTGRTHQIRVHAAHLNHPIVGDAKYNGRRRALAIATRMHDEELLKALKGLSGQMLHASEVKFRHPMFDHELRLTAPMPQDMENLLQCLKKISPS